MKTIFTVMMLMFFAWIGSVQAQVYPVGVTPAVTLSGVTLPLNRAVFLSSYCAANNQYTTMKVNGSDYAVPTGKTLYVVAYKCTSTTAAVSGPQSVGYGDDVVSNSAAAPTNAVNRYFNDAAVPAIYAQSTIGIASESPMYSSIPTGKYPFMRCLNLPSCMFMGYLQ